MYLAITQSFYRRQCGVVAGLMAMLDLVAQALGPQIAESVVLAAKRTCQ
jgi:hypothetical protein